MKYEILQDELTHLRTIKKGTVLTEVEWHREYGYYPSTLKERTDWFREVPDFKVGDFVIFDNEIMGKILGPGIFMPDSMIIQTAIRGNLEVKTNMLTPAPPIPDRPELNGVKYKVKMKNGVPVYVSEYEAIPAEARYFCIACQEVHPKFGNHIGDFNGAYILEPVEERFTLYKKIDSDNTPNFMLIEAAIRDIYDRLKGEGK